MRARSLASLCTLYTPTANNVFVGVVRILSFSSLCFFFFSAFALFVCSVALECVASATSSNILKNAPLDAYILSDSVYIAYPRKTCWFKHVDLHSAFSLSVLYTKTEKCRYRHIETLLVSHKLCILDNRLTSEFHSGGMNVNIVFVSDSHIGIM